MRSLSGEVILNVPAHTAWEMYRNNDTVSKISPDMLAAAEYLQGDGSPGSLRLFKLGPGRPKRTVCFYGESAVQDYVKESTERIDEVEVGRSVTYSVLAGCLREMYNPYKVTFSFCPVPGFEKEKCIAGWKAEFEPLNSTVPAPERAKEAALGFLRLFEKFYCSMK
ncbi:MLP-like protein 423 [Nymphaea thermarum]|nr:MLP-like protein 423 [Nymphaea thermarum]